MFWLALYIVTYFVVSKVQCSWLPVKTRLWSDLRCVEWDTKPRLLTSAVSMCARNSVAWICLSWNKQVKPFPSHISPLSSADLRLFNPQPDILQNQTWGWCMLHGMSVYFHTEAGPRLLTPEGWKAGLTYKQQNQNAATTSQRSWTGNFCRYINCSLTDIATFEYSF